MASKEKPGFISEFKNFAVRGNAIDLAVGVIIGGAFSTITTSLVNDIFMPVIGMFLGNLDFSKLNIPLPQIFPSAEPILLNLGTFISTVINFLILALVVFFVVKAVNKIREKDRAKQAAEPAKPSAPSAEVVLLTEIRDALKK